MGFQVVITNVGRTIECDAEEPVLHAAIRAGIDYPYACATGNCGVCVSDLKSGEVDMLAYGDGALSLMQKQAGKVLGCRAQPRSNIEIGWLGRGRR